MLFNWLLTVYKKTLVTYKNDVDTTHNTSTTNKYHLYFQNLLLKITDFTITVTDIYIGQC